MESAPLLHTLVVPVIGYERVDVQAATDSGIMVCNSPTPENFVSVSEASIALMTMLAKRLRRKEARIRGGEWSQNSDRGFLLWQKTVGIIGLGRTGSGVAKRLSGWDVRLLCYDPYITDERAAEFDVERVDLPTLLQESDFVTIHVVMTPETHEMIAEDQLRMMKPTAYLINTSRGEAIDEVAIRKALDEEWIAGAALDVFHQEPLPVDSPMRSLDPDRVFLTPHSIAHTHASLIANRGKGNRHRDHRAERGSARLSGKPGCSAQMGRTGAVDHGDRLIPNFPRPLAWVKRWGPATGLPSGR